MPTSPPTESTLGSRIADARARAGKTQQEVAHACGLSGDGAGAYLSRVEANRQEPRMSMLKKIARALGVTLSDLAG